MSLGEATEQLEAVDVGQGLDVDAMLARVRAMIQGEPVAGIAEEVAVGPVADGVAGNPAARFGGSVVRAIGLLGTRIYDAAITLEILEEWLRAETIRQARLHQETQGQIDELRGDVRTIARVLDVTVLQVAQRGGPEELSDTDQRLAAMEAGIGELRTILGETLQLAQGLDARLTAIETRVDGELEQARAEAAAAQSLYDHRTQLAAILRRTES